MLKRFLRLNLKCLPVCLLVHTTGDSLDSVLHITDERYQIFSEISSGISFPAMEEKVINLRRKRHVFEKQLENRGKGQEFVFYEEPPFAASGQKCTAARAIIDFFKSVPRRRMVNLNSSCKKMGECVLTDSGIINPNFAGRMVFFVCSDPRQAIDHLRRFSLLNLHSYLIRGAGFCRA